MRVLQPSPNGPQTWPRPPACLRASELVLPPENARITVAGLVILRQRPGTAKGVIFITLEDETGIANLVVWKDTFEKFRRVAKLSTILLVQGTVERQGEVVHVHAAKIESLDSRLPQVAAVSRDFH